MMANSRSSGNVAVSTIVGRSESTNDDIFACSTSEFPRTPLQPTNAVTTLTNFPPASTSPAFLPPNDRYNLNYTHDSTTLDYLNILSKDIPAHYQTLKFYRKWTSHFISQLFGIPIIRNAMSTSAPILDTSTITTSTINPTLTSFTLLPRADYANEFAILTREEILLKKWEIDVAKAEMEALASVLLTRPLPPLSSVEPDILLYRAHTSETKSPYFRGIGIRCSSWQDSLIIDQPSKEQINGRAFQDHCNDAKKPSPYISVHTSVARLMKFIPLLRSHQVTIFVISLNKLKQLGIKATCTDDILVSYKGKYRKSPRIRRYENEVSFVTNSHWLIEGWIPDQTIVSEMGMQRFLEIAKDGGIDSEVIKREKSLTDSPFLKINIGLEKWPVRRSEGTNREGSENSLRSGSETALGLGSGTEGQGAGSSISRFEPDASSEDIENRLLRLQL
ncbi:hypothetical protein sscle_16g107720 [Sclerotinia sclerotiorum 1980 UF-70]|uniref:DUF7587 domain-containing protein n=1 Tax=Sclerotinia sclerotiorum (strain ATCC 18683 / 1980 / Ss-1) TaxID=665079 RepID=A0A1D9QMG9_SCLS1|nr:hypothetical protein sscle_16g107720 [Sclerotinia sclerotiorum 1980 UF-70]